MRLRQMMKDGEFAKYWIGQTFSVFGSNVATFALPLTAVYFLEASPLQVGLLQFMNGVPFLLFSLLIGVWTDRVRRLRLMIAADFGRALLMGLIPIFYLTGWFNIYQLCFVALGIGMLSVMFETACQAFLPVFVGKGKLVEANSALQFSLSMSQISGPGVAGLMIRLFAAPLALTVNALAFLASAVFLARIRFHEERRTSGSARSLRFREATEGLRVLLRHPVLRPLTLAMGGINLFFSAFLAVYYLYLDKAFGFSSAMTGMVLTIGALGATAAVFVTGKLSTMMSPGMVVYQKTTSDRWLGRVTAGSKFFLGGLMPVGSLLGGVLGEYAGLRSTLFIGAAGITLMVVWMLLSRIRTASDRQLESEYFISS